MNPSIRRIDFSDSRLRALCAFCGGPAETDDHVPPRVFLEPPFPDDLPKIRACEQCNHAASPDEQYVACLLECILVGSSDPRDIKRLHIAKTLERDRRIRCQMEDARQTMLDGSVWFRTDDDRIRTVILKLACGHAAYELAMPLLENPEIMVVMPLNQMNDRQKRAFEDPPEVSMFPEVGSRCMQGLIISSGNKGLVWPWVRIQPASYRYLAAIDCDRLTVKFVIREYLACEVVWGIGP